MRSSRRLTREGGFTLLELLIAVLLLAVGFLATFTVIWTSQKAGTYSRNMTSAAALGADLMEQLALRNYTGLKNGTYSDAAISPPLSAFSRAYTVQQDTPAVNMKTLTVAVSWREGGQVKSRTFTTVRRADF